MVEAAAVPPSVLMYAFRDRLDPRPPNDDQLAVLLMAVATWALAEQETIDIAPLPHPRPVDGRLGFNRKRGYVEQPGLEGRLLFSMTGKGKETPGINLWALFTIGLPIGWETEARKDSLRWAIETGPWRTRNPHRSVLAICKREARRVGVLGRFVGSVRTDPQLEAAFGDVDARFRRFQAEGHEYFTALNDDCAAGLRRE